MLLRLQPLFSGIRHLRASPSNFSYLPFDFLGVGVGRIDLENPVGEVQNVIVVGRWKQDVFFLGAFHFLLPRFDLGELLVRQVRNNRVECPVQVLRRIRNNLHLLDVFPVPFLCRLYLMPPCANFTDGERRAATLLSVHVNGRSGWRRLDYQASVFGFQVLIEKDASKSENGR